MYQPEFQPAIGRGMGLPDDRRRVRRMADGVARALAGERHRLAGDLAAMRRAAIAGDFDLDLGNAMFTRRWWPKAAACAVLVLGAGWAGLQVRPLIPILPTPFTGSQRDDSLPHMIAPLAMGGRTGAPARVNARLLRPLAEPPERPRVERSVSIGPRGLAAALRNAGVGAGDVASVSGLLGDARPAASARADLVLGRRETRTVPRPLERLALRVAFDLRVEINRMDGALAIRRIPIRVDSTPLRLSGPVGGSLNRALRSAGIPAAQAGEFVRQMRHVVDFQRGLGRRDRFDIIIEQDRAETGEVRHGRLLFGAIMRSGKTPVEIGLYGGEYYLGSGEGVKRGLMKTPVDGARMSSGFGMRLHPVLGFSRMHQGVDFGAASGEPIMAAGSGTISFAGWHGGHGRYVMIRHNKDLGTAYAHMSDIAVKPGQQVRQGQVIGHVGSSGLSTGPHLHYEVWLRGRPVNPVSLRFIGGAELSGRALNAFQRQMNRWRALPMTGSASNSASTTAR